MGHDMKRYSEFRPTVFDPRGLGLADRQDWLVLDVSRTRDSKALEQSNFRVALRILGYEEGSETVEVHRFSHWGPGWFEIILLHPSREDDGRDIEASLASYPVLDEMDLSELETGEEYPIQD